MDEPPQNHLNAAEEINVLGGVESVRISILPARSTVLLVTMAAKRIDRHGYSKLRRLERDSSSIVHGPLATEMTALTFGQLLRQQAKQRPDALFAQSHHQQRGLTYEELDARSDALARGLLMMDVGRGDRIAIMAGNEIEYLEMIFACAKIGALCTLTNYAYSEHELHSVLSSIQVSDLLHGAVF